MLRVKVRSRFLASDRTYGARRVWSELLAESVSCGLHRIERLMRLQALKARPRSHEAALNLVLALPAAMAPTCITKLSPVRSAMLDSVFKALADIFTEPFSEVLIKSVVLAVALLVAIFMALGSLTVTLGGGLFAAAVMLMPAVTALVASFPPTR